MVDGDLRSHLGVLLVGAVRDDIAGGLTRLTSEYEAALIRCNDVYAAVAELAVSPQRSMLVVGRLRDLARENGRFFIIAARNAVRCCGVLDEDAPLERDEILAAVRLGVSVVAGVDEVRGVFEDWLGVERRVPGQSGAFSPLGSDEFRASEAELNALLGLDADG